MITVQIARSNRAPRTARAGSDVQLIVPGYCSLDKGDIGLCPHIRQQRVKSAVGRSYVCGRPAALRNPRRAVPLRQIKLRSGKRNVHGGIACCVFSPGHVWIGSPVARYIDAVCTSHRCGLVYGSAKQSKRAARPLRNIAEGAPRNVAAGLLKEGNRRGIRYTDDFRKRIKAGAGYTRNLSAASPC